MLKLINIMSLFVSIKRSLGITEIEKIYKNIKHAFSYIICCLFIFFILHVPPTYSFKN